MSAPNRAALNDLGSPLGARVVGIGDSVEHGIAGAKGVGISAALVRSGILAEMSARELDDVFRRHNAVPDYVLPGFVWQA